MKIENIEVFGWDSAIRGMRNPMNSWNKIDSTFYVMEQNWFFNDNKINVVEVPHLGIQDLNLACKLVKGGSEHRKFLRQIQIWFDIEIPIFIWSEFDTYKVSTVRNSCSTMHTLGLRDLIQDDFELGCDVDYLAKLNKHGENYRKAKENKDTKLMNEIRHQYKNDLPSGFLQKATYTMNYETALNMYFQRRSHRLPEWNENNPQSICAFIKSLPYIDDFIEAGDRHE